MYLEYASFGGELYRRTTPDGIWEPVESPIATAFNEITQMSDYDRQQLEHLLYEYDNGSLEKE